MTAPAVTERPPRRIRRFSLLISLVVVAIGLTLFSWFSVHSEVAGRGIGRDARFIFALFDPHAARIGFLAVAAAVVGVVGACLVARMPRVRPVWFLSAAVAFMFVFSIFVSMWRGGPDGVVGLALIDKPPEYAMDLPLVTRLGVRGYIDDYPDVIPQLKSIHSKTHPPGPVLLLAGLKRIWPRHLVPRALVIGLIAALVLVPAWFVARVVAGEQAARYTVLLLAVAPGPVIFSFTWLDAVFATILMTCSALLVWAVAGPTRPARALLAGAALGLSTLMTYAAALIAAFAVVYALLVLPFRRAVGVLLFTGLGGLAALAGLRLLLGYDLLGSYLSFRKHLGLGEFLLSRSYTYWLFGTWMAWLVYAGVPAAGLGMRALIVERPRYLIASLLPLVVLVALPTSVSSLLAGETERTWLFAMPILAVAAAASIDRWEDAYGRRAWIIAGLVAFAAAQTIMLKALYFNY